MNYRITYTNTAGASITVPADGRNSIAAALAVCAERNIDPEAITAIRAG